MKYFIRAADPTCRVLGTIEAANIDIALMLARRSRGRDVYVSMSGKVYNPRPPIIPLTSEACGRECHWHPVYGWVPEADCPVHDP